MADYLQELLPEWHVDPEYNRIRDLVKQLQINGEWKVVVPDVIAHRRNSGDNLLVLEAKKVGNQDTVASRRNLIALKEQQH